MSPPAVGLGRDAGALVTYAQISLLHCNTVGVVVVVVVVVIVSLSHNNKKRNSWDSSHMFTFIVEHAGTL